MKSSEDNAKTRKEIIKTKLTPEQQEKIKIEFPYSSHSTRCIASMRKRAIWFEDDYYNVVADEMKRLLEGMIEARTKLFALEEESLIDASWDSSNGFEPLRPVYNDEEKEEINEPT